MYKECIIGNICLVCRKIAADQITCCSFYILVVNENKELKYEELYVMYSFCERVM